MSWLEVPAPLLRAFGRKLPQLQAEEALHAASVVAVGTGSVRDPESITGSWQRAAQGPRPRPSAAERRAFASLIGINVVDAKPVTDG